MKITLETLYGTILALRELSNLKLPIKPSFKIGCLLGDLNKYMQNIEKERHKLLNELGEKDKNGVPQLLPTIKQKDGSIVPNKNHQLFIDKFNEFLKTEVDFDLEFPIDLNELENEKIEPKYMKAISIFINKGTLKPESKSL